MAVLWPVPLPAWFWEWAAWYLGRDAFKGHKQDPSLRPKSAPVRIPAWAWARLALIAVGKSPPAPKPVVLTLREKVVKWAHWGVSNEPAIHYKEVRPMPLTAKLPLTTDCSGFATLCYFLAGAPDPNGLDYNGSGYTGTLLDHMKHVAKSAARPGDLVVYGAAPGVHTAVIVEAGADPLTVSHGEESGPALVRVSQDGRMPQTFLSYLP